MLSAPFAILDPKVVQGRCGFHDLIGHAFLGVTKDVFHNARTLHSGQGMLDSDADPGQVPVRLLFGVRKLAAGWLFFSPGASCGRPVHSLGSQCLCTTPSRVDRRCPPGRRPFCRSSCPRRSGSGSRSAGSWRRPRPHSCRCAPSSGRCSGGPVFQGFWASGGVARCHR